MLSNLKRDSEKICLHYYSVSHSILRKLVGMPAGFISLSARAIVGRMLKLSHEQLLEVLAGLPAFYPKSLQLDAMIRNKINGRFDWPGTEFVVDKYPDYTVLMSRPIAGSKEYIPWPTGYTATLFCRNIDRLESVIRSDDFVDWKQFVKFFAISTNDVFPVLDKLCQEKGNAYPPEDDDDLGIVHLLNPTSLVKSELPEGFELRQLSEANAEQVNSEWHYGSAASLPFFQYVFRNNFPSSGAFTSDGQLAGYIIYMTEGCMFHGFVRPEFRNKGLFQAVNYDLAHKVAAMGQQTAWVYIMRWNQPSLNAYRKLGATKVDPEKYSVTWLMFQPPT